ncbi:MAG: PepSY domain-containing protein [Pseudomonadota bacterium]
MLTAAPAAVAAEIQPQHYAPPVGGISLEQAADKVRRQTGGRILSATPSERGGRRGYEIRVLVDGKRVKQYYVDSEGRLSSR